MKIISILAFMMLGLGACGGSSSPEPTQQPPNNPPPTGGIGRTGVAIGPISNFGSVGVNGVHYSTSSATFTVNDMSGSEDDLSVGQVVIVLGTIDDNLTTGTATDVIFDDNVTGPIDSIDLAAGRLVVFGQTVIVGAQTSFDDNISPASLEGLSVNDIVEVSGLVDGDGNIEATRIEKKAVTSQLEVHGVVSGLDTTNFRFMINLLQVDYTSATLDDFPGGEIANGDFVEVKGSGFGTGGIFTASSVELEVGGFDGDDDGTHVEVEGFITRFDSAQDFAVSGIAVITNSTTAFEGGTAADLGLNVKVEVEGEINSSGVLVAEKVDIRRSNAVRVTALVDSVDTADRSLVMLGITVEVDELTRLEDKSDADVSPLNLSDIRMGDYLEIRGDETAGGGGRVVAALLERDDPDSRTELRGFVESVNEPSFSILILGVTIETNGGTVFRDTDESTISRTDFFERVAAGSQVEARGTESSATTILAVEVEFEN